MIFYWTLVCFSIILGALWSWIIVRAVLGMRHVADITTPAWDRHFEPGAAPSVTIIVPGRNEGRSVERALTSLTTLDYPAYEVVAVNDRSTDNTGAVMEEVSHGKSGTASLRIIHLEELPPGWLGKTHAMWKAAQSTSSDWILFTDADCSFRSDCLRRAIAYAESSGGDHLVIFPTMIMESWGERMIVSFCQLTFYLAVRPWKVADPRARDHVGAGAFNLIRRSAYEKIGTYEALRFNVIDDLNLGRLVKQHGLAQRNVSGPGLVTIRWAYGAIGVVRNLGKNLFAFFHFKWPLALGGAMFLAILNLVPFIGFALARGWSRLGYGIALAAIAAMYAWLSRRTGVSPFYFLLHPLSTMLFLYALVRSVVITLVAGGVVWRGTKYPLDDLRRALLE